MPAPPTALITGMRDGTVFRHAFFYMAHSGGAVRAWDGIGEHVYDGNTYLGVGGLAAVSGLSQSADIQNHAVEVELNGVPLSAMQDTDPDIRGNAATITLVWMQVDGTVIAARTVFSGIGDILVSEIDEKTLKLTARLKGKLADWGSPVRANYTLNDQLRRHPGDTGFSEMSELENLTVSGWSITAEATGSAMVSGYYERFAMADSADYVVIGSDQWGCNLGTTWHAPAGMFLVTALYVSGGNTVGNNYYTEEGSTTRFCYVVGNSNIGHASKTATGAGGAHDSLYTDVAGDARASASGVRIFQNGVSFSYTRLRRAATIADGTAGAETLVTQATGITRFGAAKFLRRSGVAWTGAINTSWLPLIIDNTRGLVFDTDISGYTEATTGAAVTVSGGGVLQVGGADCKLSTTGMVLSPGNRRILRGGGATNYLRVFT